MGRSDYRIDVRKLKIEYGKKRWTQQIFAEKADVSVESLRKVERSGEASSSIAAALSTALGVPLESFAEPAGFMPALARWVGGSADTLAEPAMRAKLQLGQLGSANCCAFLAGDFSVLTTKRAFVFPVDARMHVSLNVSQSRSKEFRVAVYYPDQRGRWTADAEAGKRTAGRLRKALSRAIAVKQYPELTGIDATIVSELPPRFAVYEETAVALALARAINASNKPQPPTHAFDTLRLAALLLTGWYEDVTWATLVASSLDPNTFEGIVSFDRTKDGDIDLVALYERPANEDGTPDRDFDENVYPAKQFWTEKKGLSFDRSLVSIWWGNKLTATIDARERFQDHDLRKVQLSYVIDGMEVALRHGDENKYRKIGLLMQLHHLELAAADLVDHDPQKIINLINDLPDVRGAKLACWRGNGAIVVLMDPASNQKRGRDGLKKLGLKHLDEYCQRIQL